MDPTEGDGHEAVAVAVPAARGEGQGQEEGPAEGSGKSPGGLRLAAVAEGVEAALGKLGAFVARRPRTVLAGSALAALACFGGLAGIAPESRAEVIWVPQNSEPQRNKELVGRYYDGGGQRFAEVYLTRAGGGDVLASPESLRAALDLHAAIMELKVGGKTYESGLCFQNSYGACLKFGTLKLFDFDRAVFEAQAGDLQAAYKAETYADGQPVNPYEIFGAMGRTEDGDISARSLNAGYLLSQDGISAADWNAWVTEFTALLSSPQWKAHAQVRVSYVSVAG